MQVESDQVRYVVTGVRTVNGVCTTVYLNSEDGYSGWTESQKRSLLFISEADATARSKSAHGPWFNEPEASTVKVHKVLYTPPRESSWVFVEGV